MAKRILVIDDEKPIRDSFVLALEDTAFQVDTAASGPAGLQRFAPGVYDLVFLDLKMPGMNGIETLRSLREQDQNVPVYIVSAFSKEYLQDLAALSKDGVAFELATKPLSLDQIKALVQALLNERLRA